MFPSRIEKAPIVSIIVPVKNEENVVGRLLDALLKLDYPPEKMEIVVIEDGSSDGTAEICMEYARRYPCQVKFLHKEDSNGKPSALNYALKHVKGEIVCVFDADSVPKPDALLRAVSYFEDASVAVVQGRNLVINADENMLTKLISYEETVRYEVYIRGKNALNLFVPLTGSCYFVRRRVLEEVGGWDSDALSEDAELAAKLTKRGYSIRYAPDVMSWQENPSSLKRLFGQRVRWFRGTMEVGLKYRRLLKKPSGKCIDAEITLLSPFMFIPYTLGYVLGIYAFLYPIDMGFWAFLAQGMMALSTITLLLIGIAILCVESFCRSKSLLWPMFVYAYWCVENFIALYALIQMIFRRPKGWVKTEKSGVVTVNTFSRA